MKLQEALTTLIGYSGITSALVVDSDGLLIEAATENATINLDELAAVASLSLQQVSKLSSTRLVQMFLEFVDEFLIIEALDDELVLVIGATTPANIGLIRTVVKKHRQDIAQAASAL